MKGGCVPPVERRQVWREVYFTARMFIGVAATWGAIFHENKYQIALAACSTLYWWYKAGSEGVKP
jgi:hypothetical protein